MAFNGVSPVGLNLKGLAGQSKSLNGLWIPVADSHPPIMRAWMKDISANAIRYIFYKETTQRWHIAPDPTATASWYMSQTAAGELAWNPCAVPRWYDCHQLKIQGKKRVLLGSWSRSLVPPQALPLGEARGLSR